MNYFGEDLVNGVNFPVGGATGVLYARRSADGISSAQTKTSRRAENDRNIP